jgi:serine/threonine protein kinase/beta-lactam-binding protein with PASTA domain
VVGNRYRLHALIGSGASASVYVADDHILGRPVAVKILHDGLAGDERFVRRFRTEAQAAAALDHPHIVALYDWGEEMAPGRSARRRVLYLVTEYLRGGSLRAMLRRGACLTPGQALQVGLQAVRALEYAHRQGAVHRDVKPENLLFDEDGGLRIADFGLVRALAEANWSEPAGSLAATVRYASPEQARGEALDGRSDVYSLALLLVEALTGRVPFVSDTALGTLMARLDQPLPVGDELGPLAEPLRRAGDPDRNRRLDAAGLRVALSRVAEQFDDPEDLPLARPEPEPLDERGGEAAPVGAAALFAAGPPGAGPSADLTTALPTPAPTGANANGAVGAANGGAGGANGGTGANGPVTRPADGNGTRPAYRTVAGSAAAARPATARSGGPPGPAVRGGHAVPPGPGGAVTADHTIVEDRPLPPPPPQSGGVDPTVVQPLPTAPGGGGNGAAPWAPAWNPAPLPGDESARWWRALIVAAALMAGSIVGGAYWWSNIRVPSYAVPALVQRSVDDVPELIAGHQWIVQRSDDYDDGVPAGIILSQQPAPATEVPRGGTIHIVVSKGPHPVRVPTGLAGKTVAEATRILEAAGLRARQQERRNDENVPPESVVMLAPGTAESLPLQSEVGLIVSSGAAPRTIPSGLAGQQYDQVATQLTSLGLVPKRDDQFDASIPAGTVMKVDPAEGTATVAKGAPVTVTVSKGAPVVVPDVRNMDVQSAAAAIQAYGLQVGDVRGWSVLPVKGTDPAPGTQVPAGTRITIVTGL